MTKYRFNEYEYDSYEEAVDAAMGYANDLFDDSVDKYFGKARVAFFEYKTSDLLRMSDKCLYALMLSHFSDQYIEQVEEIKDEGAVNLDENISTEMSNKAEECKEKGQQLCLDSINIQKEVYLTAMGIMLTRSYSYYLEKLDEGYEGEGIKPSDSLMEYAPEKFWCDFEQYLDQQLKLLNNNYLDM